MRNPFTSTTKSARRALLPALLGVLGAGVIAGIALAANGVTTNGVPAPTISATPVNATSSQTASFTYTDSQTITKFQCSLDGSSFQDCGTTRPSSTTYTGVLAGSHTFKVRAVAGSATSPAAAFTWVVDRTSPTVSSINRAGASPTNAGAVQWTVTFSESVSGVDTSDFALTRSGGVTGGSITSVAPSGPVSTYTVTASTGSGDGTLGLNLVDNDSIKDAATNPLGGAGAGNGNVAGQAYTIDKTPPTGAPTITSHPANPTSETTAPFQFTDSEPGVTGFLCQLDGGAFVACTSPKTSSVGQGAHTFSVKARDAVGNTGPTTAYAWVVDATPPPTPHFTQTPADPSSTAVATFAWTSRPATDVDHYECKPESGAWVTCTSPRTYTVQATNNGGHQLKVRALDAAGNVSGSATYKWKVAQTNGAPFQISGNAPVFMGQTGPVTVTLTNPNTVAIYVTSLTVSISADSTPSGCPSSTNVVLTQAAGINGSTPFAIPANSRVVVPAAQSPTITLVDRPDVNQDVCKNKSFTLTYSGSAHS